MPDFNYKLTKDDVEFLAQLRGQLDWLHNNESGCRHLGSYAEELGALLNRVVDLKLFDEPKESVEAEARD